MNMSVDSGCLTVCAKAHVAICIVYKGIGMYCIYKKCIVLYDRSQIPARSFVIDVCLLSNTLNYFLPAYGNGSECLSTLPLNAA